MQDGRRVERDRAQADQGSCPPVPGPGGSARRKPPPLPAWIDPAWGPKASHSADAHKRGGEGLSSRRAVCSALPGGDWPRPVTRASLGIRKAEVVEAKPGRSLVSTKLGEWGEGPEDAPTRHHPRPCSLNEERCGKGDGKRPVGAPKSPTTCLPDQGSLLPLLDTRPRPLPGLRQPSTQAQVSTQATVSHLWSGVQSPQPGGCSHPGVPFPGLPVVHPHLLLVRWTPPGIHQDADVRAGQSGVTTLPTPSARPWRPGHRLGHFALVTARCLLLPPTWPEGPQARHSGMGHPCRPVRR